MAQPIFIDNGMLSLSELIKRLDPNGNVAPVVSILEENNELIPDIKWNEGNLINGDQITIETSEPDVYWLHENVGIPSSHSTTAIITETCGKLGACSDVSADLLERYDFDPVYRLQEDKAVIRAIGKKATSHFFYGSKATNPEAFDGFTPRYNKLSGERNSKNVVDCGGRTKDGELTSLWIVGWGDKVGGIYPKGTKAGIQETDEGPVWIDDGTKRNTQIKILRTTYKWNIGLAVKDWRYVVRLCNIPLSALRSGTGIGTGDTREGKNLLMYIIEGLSKLPAEARNQARIYANNDVLSALNTIALRSQSNVVKFMETTNEFGKTGAWSSFLGVPLRRVDQLVNTEKEVK